MIIAHSLDGCMRLRLTNKAGSRAVVELRSHLYPESWVWCVWRSLPTAEAFDFFNDQCSHHTAHSSNTVSPGV